VRIRAHQATSTNPTWEEIMGHLILQDDNFTWPGFSLLGESSLAITMDDTGVLGNILNFMVLSGTTSLSIASAGAGAGGFNEIGQLAETTNGLTTVTITGSEQFILGRGSGQSNHGDGVVTDIAAKAASPTTIHSSLTLIDASATTGALSISAGATNTSSEGQFLNGASLNANVTITYTGLTIKGGSGPDFIENDAKRGIVTEGNGNDDVATLGGADAKAILGTGTSDEVQVGVSNVGPSEAAGSGLGDTVKFGAAATAKLTVGPGAEAGSTAGTTSIGLTKVLMAADGMVLNFRSVNNGVDLIVDETSTVASSTSLNAAENAAVKAMNSAGVAYFSFHGNEYFIATNHAETAISADDAVVKLVGITDIHHATSSSGVVTLHV
jgi:hypothetical protein